MSQRSLSLRLAGSLALLIGATAFGVPASADTPASSHVDASDASSKLPVELQDIDAYIARASQVLGMPGIAIAIVKDGKVVMEKGYGVRDIGKPEKIDAHTMFSIASNTKVFTAVALQMLAEQGKLDMNDRVIDHLPWFRMSDPYVTKEMRIRDLLAHRSGLGPHAGDLLYFPATSYTTKQVVEHLRYVPLMHSFRGAYDYDNILFAVATLVIEQASGQSYADFVREHIFQPVGMDESLIDGTFLKPGANAAIGQEMVRGKLTAVPMLAWVNNRGAAGIYSNVHDMAKWMNVQLADGALPMSHGDTSPRLFSEDSQRQMWSTITPIDIDPPAVPALAATTPNSLGYGEGWYLSDYRGQRLVWHTGGWPGMASEVMLVPGLKLGVVILTNQESEEPFKAVIYHVLDAYLGAPKTDWIAAYAEAMKQGNSSGDMSWHAHVAARDPNSHPSLPLANYAGDYRDAWYGDVSLRVEGGKLRLHFSKTPQLVGTLEPWQHDTFLVHWDDSALNASAFISFTLDADGKVSEARMQRASSSVASAYDFQDLRLEPVAPVKGGN